MAANDERERVVEEARLKIERMYQRAMDLRDSTPVGRDWSKNEERYRRAYMQAYNRTQDVEAFRKSTREYRRWLRESTRVSQAVVA